MQPPNGFNLVELVVVVALLSLILSFGIPPLLTLTGGLRVRAAAGELAGVLRMARLYAIRHSFNVAVKFRTDENGVTFALYRDGDGDGVRNRDIDSGVDPQVVPPRPLSYLGHHVRFGFPQGPPPRDPGDSRRRLNRLDDPIRFNRSDLASFSPLGGSTPGSLYITDGRSHLAVVRVYNQTGKVKVLRYDPRTERWH